MLDIRCRNHLHHRVDPDEDTVHIKCDQCSRKRRRPVFHWYTRAEVMAAASDRKDVLWVDEHPEGHDD